MCTGFFDEMSIQSEMKSILLTHYFHAWMNIVGKRASTVAYMDLFSGPGLYSDGTPSTPILILKRIIDNEEWREKTIAVFNDIDPDYCKSLKKAIKDLPGIETLKYEPKISNIAVGDELAEYLEKTNFVPTLGFVDPWGYKGLSLRLIKAIIKDWGSDCIFFFNYNRINMDLTNPKVIEHLNAIFGAERANNLREKVRNCSPWEREHAILNELAEALSENRQNYVLPFRFVKGNVNRTSHYLIFVSKHSAGYTVMKDIMHRQSSDHHDGVANFSYIPVNRNRQLSLLSLFDRPLDGLADELCETFSGRTLRMIDVFNQHHINTPFVKKNYKEALLRLEEDQRIKCDPSKRSIRNGVKTMGDNVTIVFP